MWYVEDTCVVFIKIKKHINESRWTFVDDIRDVKWTEVVTISTGGTKVGGRCGLKNEAVG